ncbi:MAG: type II toxin-antitoxin system HicA family toxin [Ignavibacteria bacterium]
MKRKELVRLIEKQGCRLLREGANHTLYFNPDNNKVSTIPRHTEIKDFLSKKICKDLGIDFKK